MKENKSVKVEVQQLKTENLKKEQKIKMIEEDLEDQSESESDDN